MYLIKLAMHKYELAQLNPSTLAAASLHICLRMYSKIDGKNNGLASTREADRVIHNVCKLNGLSFDAVRVASRDLMAFNKGFEK